MFLAPYITEYLRQQSSLMILMSNAIYFDKAPAVVGASYIVVLPADDYDHGNISVGSLTHKQEDFTILIVGDSSTFLQQPWKALLAILQACRAVTVTSADLDGSMFIQCVLPQDGGSYCNGHSLEGNELGKPCIIIPCKGSCTLPTLT